MTDSNPPRMLPEPVHVLIVEDGLFAADAMRIILEDGGYRVSVADTVAMAVEIGQNDHPYVMLLDLTLPDGDGLAVLAQLDARGVARPERTIALTGHGDHETNERCCSAGCERVLLKPVSMRALLALVRDTPAAGG